MGRKAYFQVIRKITKERDSYKQKVSAINSVEFTLLLQTYCQWKREECEQADLNDAVGRFCELFIIKQPLNDLERREKT